MTIIDEFYMRIETTLGQYYIFRYQRNLTGHNFYLEKHIKKNKINTIIKKEFFF